MRVAIRADGAAFMGGGHVMRCLALANALARRGARSVFIARAITPSLAARIRSAGHELVLLPHKPDDGRWSSDAAETPPAHARWLGSTWQDDARQTAAALGSRCDWLVADHYAIGAGWHRALRDMARRILVIDDLGDRDLDCDLLVDPNYRSAGYDPFVGRLPGHCGRMAGPMIALLDLAYAAAHATARPRDALRSLFVYLGVAPAAAIRPALDAAGAAGLAVEVVLAGDPDQAAEIRDHSTVGRGQTKVFGPQPSLLPFLQRADAAVAPIGSSTWERMCLGLPTIAVTLAANQDVIAQHLHEAGLIDLLGAVPGLVASDYAAALERLARPGILRQTSAALLVQCDGRGAERLATALLTAS